MPNCREREILSNIDDLEREIAILRCELIAETESKLGTPKSERKKAKGLADDEPDKSIEPPSNVIQEEGVSYLKIFSKVAGKSKPK